MSKATHNTWRMSRIISIIAAVLLPVLGTPSVAMALPQRNLDAETSSGDSVPLALGLELVIPGAGLVYVGEYGQAMGEWLGIGVGAALVFTNFPGCGDGCDRSPGLLTLGVGLIVAARLYGIIAAPVYADAHADEAANLGHPDASLTEAPGPLGEAVTTNFYVLLPTVRF